MGTVESWTKVRFSGGSTQKKETLNVNVSGRKK